MPTASLTYSATTTIPSPGVFRVDYAITAFSEFPDDQVFILRSSDDGFDHIASVDELSAWPAVKDPQVEFYRSSTAQKDYADPDTAGQNIDSVILSLQGLVDAYAAFREVFDADRTGTLSATFN